jgi:hypothetical protein
MKTAIILFLSMQPLDMTGAWPFAFQHENVLAHALACSHVPVISEGPSVSWTHSKFPIQKTRQLERPFAILPPNVSAPSATQRSSDQEVQKRNGRKNKNNLRKKARELLAKYARLDVLGYLADKLTGGQGMAIPA